MITPLQSLHYVILTALLLLPTVARAADGSPDDKAYKPMPWHLIDTWWDLKRDFEDVQSFSIDVAISDEVPADVNLYIAPIGLGKLNGASFYGGIQTQSDGYTKSDRRLRKIGPGLLMSMWGERGHDAIRPSQGGYCQSSGHEGDFVSVRRPYKWTAGTYTYSVVRMDRAVVDGKPCVWVGAFVHSHERDEHIFIGALRFPGEGLTLGRHVANFVEVYGRRPPISTIPKLTVTFANPRVNGELIGNASASAIYPDGVPDYADAEGVERRIVIKVGEPIERAKRRTKLFE